MLPHVLKLVQGGEEFVLHCQKLFGLAKSVPLKLQPLLRNTQDLLERRGMDLSTKNAGIDKMMV